MCGEKSWHCLAHSARLGSPPHVRGKVPAWLSKRYARRITPACAGKRASAPNTRPLSRDHPRMCGEKCCVSNVFIPEKGSPPHVRGKEYLGGGRYHVNRITPACAGKSLGFLCCLARFWDHPRMCGEKHLFIIPWYLCLGSPPHVRGKAVLCGFPPRDVGITPACAGKRLKRSRSTVSPVAIVPLFPSVCNKPVVSDGSPAGRDAPLFLPAENAVPASPAYNLRSL